MSQPLLEGRVQKKHSDEDLQLINEGLRAKVLQLEGDLRTERTKNAGIDRAVQNIRDALGPFYNGMRLLFGEMDAIGVGESQTSSPKASAVWESWKEKLGGKAGGAIDALLLHGEMNAQQLRIHLKCGIEYVYKVITKLASGNLIDRRDKKIRLKDL